MVMDQVTGHDVANNQIYSTNYIYRGMFIFIFSSPYVL